MIPLEQQVCSRELAKRLEELGGWQESVFWWVDRKLMYIGGRASHAQLQGGIAAFTKSAEKPRHSCRGWIGVGRAGLNAQEPNKTYAVPEPSMGEGTA